MKKSELKYDLLKALPKLPHRVLPIPLVSEFSVSQLYCVSDAQTTAKHVCSDFIEVGGQRHLL